MAMGNQPTVEANAMNREMLEKGIALLVEDAANVQGVQFDFQKYGDTTTPSELYSCGTEACAMGLFALKGLGGWSATALPSHRTGLFLLYPLRPETGKATFWYVMGEELFGLSDWAYCTLFENKDGLTALEGREAELQVARRIEWFLECEGDIATFEAGLEKAMELPLQKEYKL